MERGGLQVTQAEELPTHRRRLSNLMQSLWGPRPWGLVEGDIEAARAPPVTWVPCPVAQLLYPAGQQLSTKHDPVMSHEPQQAAPCKANDGTERQPSRPAQAGDTTDKSRWKNRMLVGSRRHLVSIDAHLTAGHYCFSSIIKDVLFIPMLHLRV